MESLHKQIQYQFERLETENIAIPPVFTRSTSYVDDNNPIVNHAIAAFRTHIATRIKGKKIITFYPPRQSFWDYLLGRKPAAFHVKVIAKDVLVNPPQTNHEVIQMYEIDEHIKINNPKP